MTVHSLCLILTSSWWMDGYGPGLALAERLLNRLEQCADYMPMKNEGCQMENGKSTCANFPFDIHHDSPSLILPCSFSAVSPPAVQRGEEPSACGVGKLVLAAVMGFARPGFEEMLLLPQTFWYLRCVCPEPRCRDAPFP
jgi:hypothetical protein